MSVTREAKRAFRRMRAKRAYCSASEAGIFAPGPVGGIASETEGKTKAEGAEGAGQDRVGQQKAMPKNLETTCERKRSMNNLFCPWVLRNAYFAPG